MALDIGNIVAGWLYPQGSQAPLLLGGNYTSATPGNPNAQGLVDPGVPNLNPQVASQQPWQVNPAALKYAKAIRLNPEFLADEFNQQIANRQMGAQNSFGLQNDTLPTDAGAMSNVNQMTQATAPSRYGAQIANNMAMGTGSINDVLKNLGLQNYMYPTAQALGRGGLTTANTGANVASTVAPGAPMEALKQQQAATSAANTQDIQNYGAGQLAAGANDNEAMFNLGKLGTANQALNLGGQNSLMQNYGINTPGGLMYNPATGQFGAAPMAVGMNNLMTMNLLSSLGMVPNAAAPVQPPTMSFLTKEAAGSRGNVVDTPLNNSTAPAPDFSGMVGKGLGGGEMSAPTSATTPAASPATQGGISPEQLQMMMRIIQNSKQGQQGSVMSPSTAKDTLPGTMDSITSLSKLLGLYKTPAEMDAVEKAYEKQHPK